MRAPHKRASKPEPIFWITLAFLTAVAFTGGASRIDVQSLVILRPLSVLVCALALITLRREHVTGREWLFAGFAAIFALSLLHLIPLPPGLWRALPGREELARIDDLAGLGPIWRPLTLTPMNGWHALSALFAPLATLLLAVQLNREDLFRLLPLLIVLGLLSALIGLVQVLGGPSSGAYLYRVTNNGSAVGLFSNRNHAAVFLVAMFPLLALWASMGTGDPVKQRLRLLAAAAVGVFLVPLILVTGSRAGLLLTLPSLVAAFAIYRPKLPKSSAKGSFSAGTYAMLGGGALGAALLGLLSFHFSRAEAVQRLFGQSATDDLRWEYWDLCVQMFWKYFPSGSGSGSFAEAFQIVERTNQLNQNYFNHAHNDFLETAVTFGLPGIALVLVAALFYFRRALALWLRRDGKSRSVRFARTASAVLLMLAVASMADYPLRTPVMMCIFALLSLWFLECGREAEARFETKAVD